MYSHLRDLATVLRYIEEPLVSTCKSPFNRPRSAHQTNLDESCPFPSISSIAMDDHTKRRSPSEGASDSSSGQDHCSTLGRNSRSSNKGQVRHRASIACASCRERRIRCVVPEGSTECNQCKRSGAECIIRNDDERRRYVSIASPAVSCRF